MSHSIWNSDWLPILGQAVFDREKQQIAAVSRAPGNLDLFVIGFDNRVWTTFWNDAHGWNGDWFPLPGQAVFDHEKQQIAAVSRAPDNLDLFVIGFDNHVWTTFWNGNWNSDWFPLPGQAVFDRENQQVAAVSRAPDNLDLFVIGFDNHVWTTFWNGNWNSDWFPLPGQAVFDREKQQIAAVSRAPDNLDLFVIGFDNRVWTTFWNGNWNSDWFPLPGQAVFDRENQQIAAVSRAPDNLDLFVIGFDNHVWTTFWNGNWNSDWFPLPGQAVFDREKQQIAAVSRAPDNLDLFVIGFDNRVWTTFWNGNWNSDWFPLPGQAVFDRENQQLAVVSRAPDNLDLFVIGFDSHVWTTFWGSLQHEFNAQIITGGLAALGGWVKVTVYSDGAVRWQGHAHDSGADGYDFGISAVVRTASGYTIALAHSGHVGGTFTSGSRDDDWDITQPPNPIIRARFDQFANGQIQTNLAYSSDIGSALEQAVSWLIKFSVGSVFASVGVVVFVGVEIGSLLSTGSLVPGARVVEGVLWMAGPGNTLLAILAEGIASLGSRTREITQEEYDWANNEVFLGSLPPRDCLILTDTIGGGNRAFTFPRYDGKITLNMGGAAFNDPRHYPTGKYGQTFIHELVHACQIQHTKVDIALLADAFASKVCEVTTSSPYLYGLSGFDYTTLNLEQQAQVVSDWFVGSAQRPDDITNHTGIPKDPNSPYFRYINENLRIGNF